MNLRVDVFMSYERCFYFNLPDVQKALHANRTNLPYSWSMCSDGGQDSVLPLLGSRTPLQELAHDLYLKITVPYEPWFHKGQVGGWATEYGNLLAFATVRGAAHMVPFAQLSSALHLFSLFVRGWRLPNTTHPSIDECK
ncbi:Serine carboxypeptidase-like [Actinidia chinensis var. chinensis]|uniref:Serine carboxypeptidase-like n=1 Tax=Actinidia chinensis var. chinensis TaxID=1590841 RepID=A0A2R6QYL9_ACTCC|nr:Serine carboxypeptidase-like [Actinidia chinensis var. chinensis]